MDVKTSMAERVTAALRTLLGHGRSRPSSPAPVLAEQASDLITRHAPDGRIVAASPAALTLLGRLPVELEGLTPADLAHPEDLPALQALFRNASYHGHAGRAAVRLRHAAGHAVWTEFRARPTPIHSEGGGDIVTVIRDISHWKQEEDALKAARDAAEAATAAKSRFLATMSHELRTPLNAIIGFSEVMEREMFGPLGGARYREYSGLIHESGSHLLELINGILDMSKIEAGKFTLHEELFALTDVAESAAQLVRLAAERAGLTLAVEIAPPAQLAFADRRAIRQILVNLLANAIKFTPSGGQVTLSARREAGALLLAVRDTGAGIAPEDLSRLGLPFEQGHGGKEGTGLGLSLVKALAALHGGAVAIESVLGEGTCVSVRLPQAGVSVGPSEAAVPAERFRAAS
jgi:cell cycle sensor histidine kinase DivJ